MEIFSHPVFRGITPEELESVYLEKHEIDMKRW